MPGNDQGTDVTAVLADEGPEVEASENVTT